MMITDLQNTSNNWIYQSNKLIEASYSFTVLEQKLVRILASMIKKDDSDFKEYKFAAKDLCKILNINQKNIYMELDKITDKLMSRYIKIKNDKDQKFKKRHLIKVADFENGVLTLKIDEDMKEFYLKLNWYTKYQLKNIMQFKSTYSFRLYELLKQYQSIGFRIIAIEELRFVLDIEKNQYTKYANLKQKVVSVAVDEINENTDLRIEYEEIKKVRKVVKIRFRIFINSENMKEMLEEKGEPNLILPADNTNIKAVKAIIQEDITDIEAEKIFMAAENDIERVREKYAIISQFKKVSNVVGAMLKALENDWKVKDKIKKNNFTDYEQRVYDYDELEKKLLGWD